jgi:GH15 family glucan-1,4-alpha-glucosidase
MKKIWSIIGLLAILIGCSDQETEKKPKFSIKDAIEKNHVVIQNLSEKENEVMTGATKAEHLIPMFAFLDDVEANKESKLQITVFPKNGEPTTSELHFINKDKTIFKNKNKTYTMPTGEIECTSILDSHRNLMVDGCKVEPSTLLVIPFGVREYNLANVEYKKQKNK